MKEIKLMLIFCLCLYSSDKIFSQIGVNTNNPQQIFHIDGRSSQATTNPDTGAPTEAQQIDDFVVTKDGHVGIGIISPTESLDVNGKVKIRNTSNLTSKNVSPLFVDEYGTLGTYTLSPLTPKMTFASSSRTTNFMDDFNAGVVVEVPVEISDFVLNTLNFEPVNSKIAIKEDGIYQLAASVTTALRTGVIGDRVFLAFNIQKSSNNGSTWTAVSGIRNIYIMDAGSSGSYNYTTTLPLVLVDLKTNDQIRLVIFRSSGGGELQGKSLQFGTIRAASNFGTKSYTFSISKL